jgi:hypothetical protein
LPRAKHPILISHHSDRYLLLASSPDFVWAQLVELKNGETFNGHLVSCDNFMNVILREVFQTSADGDRFWKMKECYVRGNTVSPSSGSLALTRSLCLAGSASGSSGGGLCTEEGESNEKRGVETLWGGEDRIASHTKGDNEPLASLPEHRPIRTSLVRIDGSIKGLPHRLDRSS